MFQPNQQAKRLKSRERRLEVDRLNGQWAQLSMGLTVDRLDEARWPMARWLIGSMVNRP